MTASAWPLVPLLLITGPAAVVVGTLLTRNGVNRGANRILASVVLVLVVLCAEKALGAITGEHWLPFALGFPPLGFLIAPGIYLYLRALVRKGLPITARDAVHSVPFLAAYAVSTTYGWVMGTPVRVFPTTSPWHLLIIGNAAISAAYLAAAWKLLLERVRIGREQRNGSVSPLVALEEQWLRYLLILFTMLWLFAALLIPANFDPLLTRTLYLGMAAFVIAMAWFGLRWSALFLGYESVQALAKVPGPPRYATSGLSAEEARERARAVVEHMERTRCFLDSGLKMEDLARALRLTEYQVSQVLNVGLGENFFSLVARYRVEEAKKLLGDGATGENVLEVAYRVGFNSKSTFNTAFKKLTGMTPSAYRKGLAATARPSAPTADRPAPERGSGPD